MKRALLSLLFLISLAVPVVGHGIGCTSEQSGPAIIVTCSYDGDVPAANANVEVGAPSDIEVVWQAGQTDRNGRFAFIPSESGSWRVVVDDNTGHRAVVRVAVNESGVTTREESATGTSSIPLIYRIAFGLALIFGASGLFYGFKSRKPTAQA